MPKNPRENAGEILHTPERDVAVAERGADDLDPDLVRLGRVHDDLLDGQRLASGPAHGRFATDGLGDLTRHGREREEIVKRFLLARRSTWKGRCSSVVNV